MMPVTKSRVCTPPASTSTLMVTSSLDSPTLPRVMLPVQVLLPARFQSAPLPPKPAALRVSGTLLTTKPTYGLVVALKDCDGSCRVQYCELAGPFGATAELNSSCSVPIVPSRVLRTTLVPAEGSAPSACGCRRVSMPSSTVVEPR